MGQKVHPGGLRVGDHPPLEVELVHGQEGVPGVPARGRQDPRAHLQEARARGALGHPHPKDKQRITVDIYTARPGIVIGKSGVEVDALRRSCTRSRRRTSTSTSTRSSGPSWTRSSSRSRSQSSCRTASAFRRAMKRALASAIRSGAAGVKIQCCGRLGGGEMSRARDLHRGSRPAAHDPRRHRLRLRRGEDDVRPHRRQGLDQQGRDHARGVRGHRGRRLAPRRPGHAPPSRRRASRASAPPARRPWPRSRPRGPRAGAPAPAAAPAAAAGRRGPSRPAPRACDRRARPAGGGRQPPAPRPAAASSLRQPEGQTRGSARGVAREPTGAAREHDEES